MTRTEPFYKKFDKINEMLKNTTDHTPTNVCRMMLEAGFQVYDTFVAVCDDENWTYLGIYPNVEWAKSEAKGNYVEGTKRLLVGEIGDYYWETTRDTLKTIAEIGKYELLMPVEYDSIKKTIWIEEYMLTIENCPSEEELDADLINEVILLEYNGLFPSGSYTINCDEIEEVKNKYIK